MTKTQQITSTLLTFYQKPVAQVSFELFLSIVTVLFFAVFAIRPTLLTMSDLIKELEDKRKLEQQLNQKVAALTTSQGTYLSIQEQLPILDEAIPAQPEFLRALKILEKTASDRQLIINTMIANEVPAEKTADITASGTERTSVPVGIIVTGNFPQIKGFIEDLVQLRRVFIIDTIIFVKSEERGQDRLKATITIGIPFYSN
jgi:Tfp pilus assembly protein PilO